MRFQAWLVVLSEDTCGVVYIMHCCDDMYSVVMMVLKVAMYVINIVVVVVVVSGTGVNGLKLP